MANQDLTGQKFGYWEVVERDLSKKEGGHRYYLCRCVCGKEKILRGSMLLSGSSVSCRCMTSKLKNIKHAYAKSYHKTFNVISSCNWFHFFSNLSYYLIV